MSKPNGALSREVRRLLRDGRIYRGRWMHVRAIPSTRARTLISVRRRFGGAVLRNRVRRRIRSIFRELNTGEFAGHLVLISVGDRSAEASFQALRDDLKRSLKALDLRTD